MGTALLTVLLLPGLACMAAALLGRNVKFAGIEVGDVSKPKRLALAAVGVVFVAVVAVALILSAGEAGGTRPEPELAARDILEMPRVAHVEGTPNQHTVTGRFKVEPRRLTGGRQVRVVNRPRIEHKPGVQDGDMYFSVGPCNIGQDDHGYTYRCDQVYIGAPGPGEWDVWVVLVTPNAAREIELSLIEHRDRGEPVRTDGVDALDRVPVTR